MLLFKFQFERKQEKEQNQELTEKLDKEFKDLMGSMAKFDVSLILLTLPEFFINHLFIN